MNAWRVIVILSACQMAVPEARGREVSVQIAWDDLRTVVAHAEFLPKTRVWTGADGRNRVRGRLIEVNATGLTIERKDAGQFIQQSEVHSIRLVPRRPGMRRNRTIAAILAVPIGVGSLLGALMLTCPTMDVCLDTPARRMPGHLGLAVGVPYLVYRHARNMDRVAIRFVVEQGKEPEEQP